MSSAPAPGTVVMTGASRGLGRIAARVLLESDPELHLVVIARSTPSDLTQELRSASGNPNVSAVLADLASVSDVRAATEHVASKLAAGELPPLRAIVANAGLQFVSATHATPEGIESTFAVNVLANYALITGLASSLTPPARIIVTASDTHFGDLTHNMGMVPAPRWQDPARLATPDSFARPRSRRAGRTAYSTSKLAVIYLVHKLATELAATADVYSFNPGFVPDTGLARDAGPLTRAAMRAITPIATRTRWARTPMVSGTHLAYAAIGPTPGPTGAYINGAEVEPSSPASYDPDREETLWNALARLAERGAASGLDRFPA